MTDTHDGVDSPRRAARAASRPAGFDDLLATAAPPPQPDRRKRRRRRWIALAIVVVILGGLTAGGVWAFNAFGEKAREVLGWGEPADWEDGLAHGEALVTIAPGDGGQAISQTLFDAGVTRTPEALYDLLVKASPDHPFQPGVFRLQQQMTAKAALAALDDPSNRVESKVLLREGVTVAQILPAISNSSGIPLADLEAAVKNPSDYGVAADSLEGWLFPATYTFAPGATATEIIQRLVDRTVQSLNDAGVPTAERQRILTIASIIQREARESADFFKVSRVIQNRLSPDNEETHGLLQMDSTAQYGIGELQDGAVSSSEEALTNDNPWNTYKHPGLPAGPIANPGDVAIDAAMHPVDGPWYYFTTINLESGETVFSSTYAEQLAAVERLHEWCAANPNGGCYR